MTSDRSLLERQIERVELRPFTLERFHRRRQRKDRNRRIGSAVVALAVAAAGIGVLARAFSSRTVPASDPFLGVFEPVAGRIVYVNEGIDRGYDPGLWAVDPSGPSDTTEGLSVADDVASTLVQLAPEDAIPLGWSSDGTELLFKRAFEGALFPEEYLYVLHADGSETQLNSDPLYFAEHSATIAPDGDRVVFAAQGDRGGLYVVDAEGGRPVRLPAGEGGGAPTFSPDGTQIAYLVYGDDVPGNVDEEHVWVADADGGNAHEILANEETVFRGVTGLRWSPEGDRLAIGLGMARGGGRPAIYTFAPDGSDFAQVITGGISPYWSPDGSQMAYTIPCDEHPDGWCPAGSILRSEFDPQPGESPAGLAIADADGSNVRAFGFAASGPWHPGVSATDDPAPTPDVGEDGVLRSDGEVLGFTGEPGGEPGDLVAVDPGSGEERVLVEDLETVYSASWSADGRWVAYEAPGPEGIGLWVVSASQEPRQVATDASTWVSAWQEPRQVATDASTWVWSSTGANLATIRLKSSPPRVYSGATLSTIDPVTGETTEVGSIPERVGDVTSAPAWSPDGTRFVFGARGGALYSVDVRSGERSLLVRLPGEDLDSIDEIAWSPDGAHIAVMNDWHLEPGGGRLYVMDADGSNVRVLTDDFDRMGLAWSLDGTRLAYVDGSAGPDGAVSVASMDGSAPTEIGSPPATSCGALIDDFCDHDLTWSPDGSQIAFRAAGGGSADVSAIDADGQGEAERIDDLTYRSWDGGWYSCECT